MPLDPPLRLQLLIVDEDTAARTACVEIARQTGFHVIEAAGFAEAQAVIRHQQVDLLLMDIKAFSQAHGRLSSGLSLVEEVKSLHPETSVIVMTVAGTVESAVEAMRSGAEDYLTKPFALDDLVERLERAAARTHVHQKSRLLRDRLRLQRSSGPLIGQSPEMEKLYRILSKVAQSTHAVLIVGEHGTGKELVARTIHFHGPTATRPFIPVDCASTPAPTLESELFGYVAGALLADSTRPAATQKEGLLCSAHGGTLFLEEVAALSLEMQGRLVKVLQEKTVKPIGASQSLPLTARILASTQVDLPALVDQGRFRRDLYFRLNVVNLRIPPLRQRKGDVPELAQFFLERVERESEVTHTLSDEALQILMAYDWPGNVRELQIAIERACTMSSGPVLHVGDLPTQLRQEADRLASDALQQSAESLALRVRDTGSIQSIAEVEKTAILSTLRQLEGDKLLAAKLLGIGKTTLYRKLKEYGFNEFD